VPPSETDDNAEAYSKSVDASNYERALSMIERANGTMMRADKGPVKPPPTLDGAPGTVADMVSGWPRITATVHWDLYHPSQVDGIDFYVGDEELGHIHLDGSVHLATTPSLGAALVADGLAEPFPYVEGWVHEQIARIGPDAAVALFRRNYERLLDAR